MSICPPEYLCSPEYMDCPPEYALKDGPPEYMDCAPEYALKDSPLEYMDCPPEYALNRALGKKESSETEQGEYRTCCCVGEERRLHTGQKSSKGRM